MNICRVVCLYSGTYNIVGTLGKQLVFNKIIPHQVTAMNDFSSRLRAEHHYESKEIQSREKNVMKRRTNVKRAVAERRSKLEDCRRLMVFLQDCNEVA